MNGSGPLGRDEGSLLARAVSGDRTAMDELLTGHRERLRRMVELRMDRHLRARVDASDVIQEAFLEACERLPEYVARPKTSFFLWLRYLTRQRLVTIWRRHAGTKQRDPRLEVAIDDGGHPAVSSDGLAAALVETCTTPSGAAARAETVARIHGAMARMEPLDREILALRHFEQLSNSDAARELGISEAAASKRYIRAARRLHELLVPAGRMIPSGV